MQMSFLEVFIGLLLRLDSDFGRVPNAQMTPFITLDISEVRVNEFPRVSTVYYAQSRCSVKFVRMARRAHTNVMSAFLQTHAAVIQLFARPHRYTRIADVKRA
jgi:hypothetical protein